MASTTVRIVDKIQEDYKEWNPEKMIFIFSGTGSGKTTFALRTLTLWHLEQGHNILYLVPRAILGDQIEKDMMKIKSELPQHNAEYFENFEVWSYQYLENLLLMHKGIKKFDVIICDEFHYWITDSMFNFNTQLSYDYIINQCNSIRVLMSATPTEIRDYISDDEKIIEKYMRKVKGSKEWTWDRRNNIIDYTIPSNYEHVTVKYITKNEEIIEVIEKSNGKSIVFVYSKTSGRNIKKSLDTKNIRSTFITADNKYAQAKDDVAELVNTNTFSAKALITTSVLDVGVNFLDEDIKNIIIVATEPTEFLQMLGRIRVIQDGQEVHLFIHSMEASCFQKLRDEHIALKLQAIECLEKYSDNLESIFKDYKKGIYNIPDNYQDFLYINSFRSDVISINKLAVSHCKKLYALYNEVYENMRRDSDYFIKLQLAWLGLEGTFSVDNFYSEEIKRDRIKALQEAIECEIHDNVKVMDFDKCKKMLVKFKPLVRKIDNTWLDNNENLSVKMFNHVCPVYGISYCIAQGKETKTRTNLYYLLRSDDEMIEKLKLTIQV